MSSLQHELELEYYEKVGQYIKQRNKRYTMWFNLCMSIFGALLALLPVNNISVFTDVVNAIFILGSCLFLHSFLKEYFEVE